MRLSKIKRAGRLNWRELGVL
jgi:hypothetical protein